MVGRSPLAEHTTQGLDLDRVADAGSRAVGLDIVHAQRIDTSIVVGLAQPGLLPFHTRCHKQLTVPIVIGGATTNHGVNRIAIG